jgi:uncharacterized DUF497 family protein
MEFEWDDAKAEANLRKHEVSFPEAASTSPILSPPFFLISTIQTMKSAKSLLGTRTGTGCWW